MADMTTCPSRCTAELTNGGEISQACAAQIIDCRPAEQDADPGDRTMTVYVDDSNIPAKVRQHDATWCHLFADSQEELHAFARKLGLRRSYFQQGKPRGDGTPDPHWHYDVTAGMRKRAVSLGAQQVQWRDTPRIMRDREAPT